jgi:3-phosphoshikimate 1-carboxyvinyltransferase
MESDAAEVAPAAEIRGTVRVPGDKSISHRLAMLGGIADGTTTVHNFAESADCQSTLECLRRLGVTIRQDGSTVTIQGRGLDGFTPPSRELDAGNSGTTVRLMSGILSGQSFESTIIGDASLSRRPMRRVMDPLRKFGATLTATDDNFLPLQIRGTKLTAIDYTLPVASAQVKSAVLLAGLFAGGTTRVREPLPSRNHTELALKEFGATVRTSNGTIEIDGGARLRAGTFTVPGDISSAAFLVAAAATLPGSLLRLVDVGMNQSRSGFISILQAMGAHIRIEPKANIGGEPIADIHVEGSELSGMEVAGAWIPNVIDELLVLAVLGTRTRHGIRIRDAAELRSKESDRIHAAVANLRILGAEVDEFPDGLFVHGGQRLKGGTVKSFDDHRIAMAFAVSGLFAEGPVKILGSNCVGISFPGFFRTLSEISNQRALRPEAAEL